MTRSYWITVALLFMLGGLRSSGFLLLAALLLAVMGAIVHLWTRYALAGVHFQRTVHPTRVELGATARVAIEIVNAKPLPLPWLRIDAPLPEVFRVAPGPGLSAVWPAVRELPLAGRDRRPGGASRGSGRSLIPIPTSTLVRLAPNDRFQMDFDIQAVERGVHALGPIWLRTADPLGFRITRSRKNTSDRIIVPPPRIPLEACGLAVPIRDIERGASNNLNRSIVLVLDLPRQARPPVPLPIPFPGGEGSNATSVTDPDVVWSRQEWLLGAAASAATHFIEKGWEVALETGVYRPGSRRRLVVRAGRGPEQLDRILEMLAWVSLPATYSSHRLVRAAARRAKNESIVWVLRDPGSEPTRGGMVQWSDSRSTSEARSASDPESPAASTLATITIAGRARSVWLQSVADPEEALRGGSSESKASTQIDAWESDGESAGPPPVSGWGPRKIDPDWVEEIGLPVARLVFRIAWLWPWTVLLSQIVVPGRRPGISLAGLAVLTGVGFGVGRLGTRTIRFPAMRGIIIILLGVLAVLVASWFWIYRSVIGIWDVA
ncbi:MAG: hypothetical protein KC729_04730 [Candidatus Eisenbacteria bacterium]|uniref:DUF58 domain-containing protein n=1 Tax=Eiseniibacteriota bacterium TaxID=2212470 RepID=A0A956LZH3_UNCEI|nr:hypothetical protein [Candidatus Eisenbacteria bacterium]